MIILKHYTILIKEKRTNNYDLIQIAEKLLKSEKKLTIELTAYNTIKKDKFATKEMKNVLEKLNLKYEVKDLNKVLKKLLSYQIVGNLVSDNLSISFNPNQNTLEITTDKNILEKLDNNITNNIIIKKEDYKNERI